MPTRSARRDADPVLLPGVLLACTGALGLLVVAFACIPLAQATSASHGVRFAVLATFAVLFGVPSLLAVVGALAALRRSSYRMAVLGSVASWAAVHTTVLGISVGIWLFVVLRRPEVRATFRGAGQRTRARVVRPGMDFVAANAPGAVARAPLSGAPPRHPTSAPAACMIVCGALGVLLWAAVALLGARPAETEPPPTLLLFVEFVVACVVLAGGIAMARRRAWELAVAGAGLLLVSCVCALPGIPVGIWSLVVLLRPDVRASFAGGAPRPPGPQRPRR